MLACGKAPQYTPPVELPQAALAWQAPPPVADAMGAQAKVAQFVQQAVGLPWPMAETLIEIWAWCGGAAEVERLLRKAAPDVYDD
mmetsp:Transcript_85801/g.237656  ORF Transcript_85801/g.237656 Transcript_85801/m.237656 type:complete len:85 (+) Transcript_85801:326-580(+)